MKTTVQLRSRIFKAKSFCSESEDVSGKEETLNTKTSKPSTGETVPGVLLRASFFQKDPDEKCDMSQKRGRDAPNHHSSAEPQQ